MNKLFTLFVAITLILFGCEQETYHKIEKDTWYLFNEGDTIFYLNNGIRADTFIVERYASGYEVSNHKYYYENIVIEFSDAISYIHRDYNSAQINWSRFGSYFVYKNESKQTYIIDNFSIENVYCSVDFDDSDSDIVKIFYTDNYGIIAYELYNGELFEIDVSCLPEMPE